MKKANKKRNPVAKQLRHFKNKVIKNKRIYDRKNNKISTTLELMEKDLTENTEFRIKWPRGQLGALPADSEQYMMIEDLYKSTDKLQKHIENMALNKVNIEFLTKQMEKVLEDIEELKDGARDMHYKNGNGK